MYVDSNGAKRYTMKRKQLEKIYMSIEDFQADCTTEEASKYRQAFVDIKTLLHKHLQLTQL